MDNNERKDVNDESRARRLTLLRGEGRAVTPHQAPKLELLVNADRNLFEAVMANDPRRVSTWLRAVPTPTPETQTGGHRSSRR